jgi:lysophospholipase L1-like esterase
MVSSSTRVASVTPDINEGGTQVSQHRRRFQWVARLYVPILTIILVMAAGRWLSSGHLPGDVTPELAVLEPGTGPANLKADEIPRVQDVLKPDRPVVPGHLQLLYLGNSQTGKIADPAPGDLTSAQWLQLFLARNQKPDMRPVDVRQGSLPGMAMPEMFMSVLSYAERNPRQVDVAVLAISPEFFRKLGLREEVKHMAADPQVHSALVSLLSNSSEFPAAYNVLEPLIAAPTGESPKMHDAGQKSPRLADRLESWLEAKADHWRLFAKREPVMMKFDYLFMAWRNRILGIKTSTPRPITAATYTGNLELVQLLFRYAKDNGIELIVYLTPLRQSKSSPYTAADCMKIDEDLGRLTKQYGFPYFNYLALEPDDVFTNLGPPSEGAATSRKFHGEPDYVHFVEQGHKILAERLFADADAVIANYQGGTHK